MLQGIMNPEAAVRKFAMGIGWPTDKNVANPAEYPTSSSEIKQVKKILYKQIFHANLAKKIRGK